MNLKNYVWAFVPVVLVICLWFVVDRSRATYWESRADTAITKKNVGMAMVALMRAEQYAGLLDRIKIINKRLSLKESLGSLQLLHVISVSFEWLVGVVEVLPLIFLQSMVLGFLFILGYFLSQLGLLGLVRTQGLLLFFTVFLGGALFLARQQHVSDRAVLLRPHVVLSAGPGQNFPQIGTLKGPEVVRVADFAHEYIKIIHKTTCGWVPKTVLEII